MIRLHVRTGVTGEDQTERRLVRWCGQSSRELGEKARNGRPEWEGVELQVGVDGMLVTDDDLDRAVPDNVDVVVAPKLGAIGTFLIYVIAAAVVSAAINGLIYLLTPRAKPPGVPQPRGDEASPTYSWQGVQTSHGQGLLVPLAYGEHDVGGQVISTLVTASTAGGVPLSEQLEIVLALCEGEIDSIGDVSGDFDNLTGAPTFPANLVINNNRVIHSLPTTGISASGRTGRISQGQLPSSFSGAAATLQVGEQLNGTQEAIATINVTEELLSVAAVLFFPGGLYQLDPSGGIFAYPVSFAISWRPVGTLTWRFFFTISGNILGSVPVGTTAKAGVAAETIVGFFDTPGTSSPNHQRGPVEIRVQRQTPAGGTDVVDQCAWRQLGYTKPGVFQYPRTALLALAIAAAENFSGSVDQFRVRGKWKKVRLWDAAHGWSAPTWEVPISQPFNFHQFPAGNNPAWVLLDFLLDRTGLGQWIKEENVDLQSFRDWSVYCDQHPGPPGFEWPEPRFRFDGVIDVSRPAWEWVLAICQAGRASPMIRGNKIAIRYMFRDAHSDQGAVTLLTIPAKTRTQLFCDANVKDPQVEYVNRALRPSILEYQYISKALGYQQSTFPVEETDSYLPHLLEVAPSRERDHRRDTIQAFGVVRETQLYREGVFVHRMNRKLRKVLTFKTGIWALASEPGDVIGFQHDVLRPHPTQAFGLTIKIGGLNVTSVTVDRDLTPTGGTDKLLIRGPAGEVIEEEIVSIVGAVVTLQNAVSVNAGAPCAFGREDEIVQDYEIIDITLEDRGLRTVRAVEWQPTAFDEPINGAGGSLDNSYANDPGQPNFELAPVDVDPADIVLRPSISSRGKHMVSWAPPVGRARARFRVYMRPTGSVKWWKIAEVTSEDAEIEWEGISAWQTWDVAVAIEDSLGSFAVPDGLRYATLEAEEFPWHSPPDVQSTGSERHSKSSAGLLLRWDPVDGQAIDYYEVRHGSQWVGATVLYRGREPEFLWKSAPKHLDLLHIAARSRSGLYSARPLRLDLNSELGGGPPNLVAAASDVFEIPPNGSLPTEIEYSVTVLRLKDGYREGTYTAPEVDLGFAARVYWSVSFDAAELLTETLEDWDWPIGGGEARWRTIASREASPAKPGLDWGVEVTDWPTTVEDLIGTNLTVAGRRGEPGSHTRATVESRYFDDSGWSDWAEHHNGWRAAQKIQVRIKLGRDSLDRQVEVKRFTISAQF